MALRRVVFLVNLLQDVNIVRPLVLLAVELGARVHFLVSDRFLERDGRGIWKRELEELCADTGARQHVYDSEFAALQVLKNRSGLLIAASESSLSAHAHTHNVMRVAPPDFLKVTLQHGYECVGFLQSREHEKAHGRRITFAADVICGWCERAVMRSLAPSESSKYLLTGPSSLLYEAPKPDSEGPRRNGMVCENLHSVRMHVSGDFKAPFMETFLAFCKEMARTGRGVTLRPHPGGQYVLKNNVELPSNVGLNNLPMYKVDLTQYAYGISAPSSVLIDMVLAGIPVAVWQDGEGIIDATFYEGLTLISGLDDWIAFVRDVEFRREMLLERQARFIARTRMLVDRQQVRNQYVTLLQSGLRSRIPRGDSAKEIGRRVMLVANALIPTLQLSFMKPFAADVEAGHMELATIFSDDILTRFAGPRGRFTDEARQAATDWIEQQMEEFNPTLVVMCRYSGLFTEFIVETARALDAPVVFHIDDDLLNVPLEIGAAKHRMHNHPERLGRIRYLLESSDLVYCSTTALLQRFRALGFGNRMVAGEVYCTGKVMRPAVDRPVFKIGYMGFDHAHDLELILPAIVHTLRVHTHVTFELFGSIPKPAVLEEFGTRVTTIPPVRIYTEFMEKFAGLDWDIGLCPLVMTPFNVVKANTKWIEYTAIGAAVIASRGMAYDGCCSSGCGILAETLDEWTAALDLLCTQSDRRFAIAGTAQSRLEAEYSDDRLRAQILEVFQLAHEAHSGNLA
jgi:hypothetical protein